ncbi:uncharacterized protein KY384_007491 [Bacidia gigantensis]|uniref:uncharacterized protein n=1 Tax=Bacidia gigantensis TaxID=2732470 RepID=UPI001D04063F|nr:uncharacterized protein KY384_007491 [Bacidia gigantensis]KAG8527339.1 hypothetical protein KY384_007491 [Bacidia gigantensis]
MEGPAKHVSLGGIALPADRSHSQLFFDCNTEPVEDKLFKGQEAKMSTSEDVVDSEAQTEVSMSPRKSIDLEQGIASTNSEKTQFDDEDSPPSPTKEEKRPSSPPPSPPPPDPNLIQFSGPDDPANPQNWLFRYKVGVTGILASLTFTTTFTSSIFSTCISATSSQYHVSEQVTTLGTSLFLLGFTLGPIIFGPASELYGRRPPLLVGTFVMSIFQVGVASGANIQTILICRFFAGVFGVAPLCIVGGSLADFWSPVARGVAVGIYSMCTFVGPVAAPIMGGYIAQSYLGWRWTEWIGVIMALLSFTLAAVFLPETSHPRILQVKARALRAETGNWALHSSADEKVITPTIIVERYLTRPFRMLHLEPILAWLCTYIGLTYGILYLFLTAYPISFERERGWSQGNAGLPFLAISIGVIAGGCINAYWSVTSYRATLAASQNGDTAKSPEARLPPMILGGLLLPPGLFWWAWTSFPTISPWPQILAGVPMGMGILLILVNGLNYIVDVYKCYCGEYGREMHVWGGLSAFCGCDV